MNAVDVGKAVEYVMACMNFDGGFGRVPGSESHAGQVRGECKGLDRYGESVEGCGRVGAGQVRGECEGLDR
jgi:hypothetical protein